MALFNSHIPIGSAYTAVTRAYDPTVLSSAICEAENMGAGIEYCISPVGDQDDPNDCFQGIDNGWRQINFSELYDPPPASDLLTRYQSCFPGNTINADFASMMFVKPQLAFPPDVTDIDSVWATWGASTCTPVNLGVYDPPRLLQKATALAPVSTPAADPQAEKASPSPAATLNSPVAAPTKTAAAASADPNNGVKANDPGSDNAGTATPTTTQSNPVAAIVDPVDSSVVAQNEGSPATGNSDAVQAGSNSNSNSDPVAAVADPANGSVVEQDESSSTTGNSDPSTAPITLLPQQSAYSTKENSGTSGQTDGTSGGSSAGSNGDSDSGTNDGNANPASIASLNSQPITKDTSGNIILSGSALAPGSTAVYSGHTIVNAPSAVVIDGSAYAPSATTLSASPLLANNQLLQMTNGGLELGTHNLVPGTSTTINNHVIDYANPSQVIEDGVTHNLAAVSSSNPLVLDGNTLQRAANGGLITAGTTIAPGSTAAISGHVYSLAGSSIVVMDGNTYALPAVTNAYQVQAATSPTPTPSIASGPLTLSNGLVITAQPSTSSNTPQNYILPNGASLSAGGNTAVYSGTTYSALPSNAGILAAGPSGTSTLALPTIPPTATQSIYTAAGATFTPEASGFPIGTTTLAPGGQAFTTSGTIISLGTSGTFLLGTSTVILPSQSIFAAGGAAFTAEPTGFDIGTTSLTPGGAAYTTDGTVVSLGTNSILSLGSTTFHLGPQSVFTLADGQVFTAEATGFAIAGTTVLPGASGVDEGGETVSLGGSGVLRIGSQTVTLGGSTATTTTGLGGAIVSGLGGGYFEGGAARGMEVGGLGMVVAVGIGVVAVVV